MMKRRLMVLGIVCAIILSAFSPLMAFGYTASIETLEDVIKAVENANESDYSSDVWNALQENYDMAKRLSGNQQYFAIRADVPDESAVLWDSGWPSGHNNYNKYVSILENSTQAYLAYKGHGENDYEKADFTADQLWERVVVDEEKGVFMLRNLEYNTYLCGHRQDGSWSESPHQYFFLLKLSEIQDISRAHFYLEDDNILRIEYLSPNGAVYVDMYHSNDTLQSGGIQGLFTFPALALTDPRSSSPKCVFEEVDVSDDQLDIEAETKRTIEDTRALLQLSLTDFLKPLYQEYQSALGDLPKHYTDSADYENLQANLKKAKALMNGGLVCIKHIKSEAVIVPTSDGKAVLTAAKNSDLAQVWYCLSSGNDNMRFLNASSGGVLYHSDEQLQVYQDLVDYGYYLKVGDAVEDEAALFTFGTKNNLQPLLARSESVDTVTVAFMDADYFAFTTAGISEDRAVHLTIADTTILKNQASSLLSSIRNIRKNRLNAMDSTVSQLKKMLDGVDQMQASDYTETSWNALSAVYHDGQALAEAKEPTTAQINLAVYGLEQAIAALKKSNDIVPAGDPAYAEVTAEIQPLYTIYSNKAYVKETSDRARQALGDALTVAANGTKGTALVTFGQLDKMRLAAHHAYTYLVESQHYNSLVSAVNAVTNRDSLPDDYVVVLIERRYQPATWQAFQTAYESANSILKAFDSGIWETTSTDVRQATDLLKSATSALVDKPDYTALSSVLKMLDNMEMDYSVFTSDSRSAYETVYRVAKELVGDEYAGQVAVDALTNELIVAANSLRIDGVQGEIALLPGLKTTVKSNETDRYDDGYDAGYLEGSSGQYVTGYTDGALSAENDFNASLKKTSANKAPIPDPVEEVTSILNKSNKKNTVLEDDIRIFLPTWLILVLAGGAVAVIAVGFTIGFLIAKLVLKRKFTKAGAI